MSIRILFFILLSVSGFSQTFKGKVIDKVTQQPLETATVYFNNTTVGTTTDNKGEFSITYSDDIQSDLVISFLGYEPVYISNYREKHYVTIEMVEAKNSLDEVYIEYDDGLTRKQKLKLFRKEFLGTSKNAKSCKILNEDDIILRYNKKSEILYAHASKPLVIFNKALSYELQYDIIDFSIEYKYTNLKTNEFVAYLVTNTGTSLFIDLTTEDNKRVSKKRNKTYKGSPQHFIKSLYQEALKDNDYRIFHKSFMVNPWAHFTVEPYKDSELKSVTLNKRVDILYKKNQQSFVVPQVSEFYIDKYGNYSPNTILFGGYMGKQRIGDMLPLDFKVKN